ncbi:MAG: hypothetical protein GEV09_25090 [Pseudonocardiaceae bacterium]|nr:hypothetical protein [Pseudonocardiaceae bacterium]
MAADPQTPQDFFEGSPRGFAIFGAVADAIDSIGQEVAHPSSKVWMHHIEMWETGQVEEEVISWLREAYESVA